jgi:hypothetical protein
MGVSGAVVVTISAATLRSIAVTPASPTISVGGMQQFTAMGTFSDGSMLDLSTIVTWSSSNVSIADVSNAVGSEGQATGFRSGSTTISAQRGSITGFTTLFVR